MDSKLKLKTIMIGAAALAFVAGQTFAQITIPPGDTPVTVEGEVVVEDTVQVRPAPGVPQSPVVTPGGTAVLPGIEDNGDGTSTVYTQVGEVTETRTLSSDGGVTLETNGDGTFESGTQQDVDYDYLQAVRFLVDNDTGLPIGGTEEFLGGYVDSGTGDFVELGLLDTTTDPTDPNTWLLDIDALAPAEQDAIATENDVVFDGGDVFVGGGVKNLDGTNLISRDEEGAVHIGDNSLVTQEEDGVQKVWAEDENEDSIDIDITNGSDLLVDGESVMGNIDQNADDIVVLDGRVTTNEGDITDNRVDIDGNRIDIDQNADDIVVLDGRVTTNEGNITQNANDITAEVAIRSALIREVDGMIHIGNDSLITGVVDGQQLLRAQEGGEDIDIRINGDTNLIVDNELTVHGESDFHDTLQVRPATDELTTVEVTPGDDTELPAIDNGDDTSTVYTQVGNVNESQIESTGGGVTLETNGNATLARAIIDGVEYEYLQVTRFLVDNNTGMPIAGTEEFVGGYVDPDSGEFVELGVLDTTTDPGDPSTWLLDIAALTSEQREAIGTVLEDSDGGNLLVEGDATVEGEIIAGGGVRSGAGTNLIDREAIDVGETDPLNVVHVGDPDDDHILMHTDTTVAGALFVGEDIFIGANPGVQAQLDDQGARIRRNRRHIQRNQEDIETNRRGIAMVAAMSNATVLPGNTMALDVNVSHFEGETGLAAGYGYRINNQAQFNVAGATTFDFEEMVVRGGMSFQW